MNKRTPKLLAALLGALAGCSGGDTGMSSFDGVEVTLPAPAAFAVSSSGACFVDNECPSDTHCFQSSCRSECNSDSECQTGTTCSARRRCEGAGSTSTANVVAGVGIAIPPPNRITVLPGQNTVTVTVEASDDVEAGAIAYSMECFESVSGERAVDGTVHKSEGTREFEIAVPTTMANPNNPDAGPALITVQTSIGSFEVVVTPRPSAGGTYAGPVVVRELGGVPLALDLELVTRPDGASLEDAEEAWLVLPIRNDTLFAPHPVIEDGPDAAAAPLTLDAGTGSWVAVFDHSFELTEGGPFGHLGESQVERILRFEITMEDGRVSGQMSDRWSGLFDERSASGVRSAGDVLFQGDIELERAGPGRGFAELPEAAVLAAPAPGPRERPAIDACAAIDLGAIPDIEVNGVTRSCAGLTDIASFEASGDAEARLSCAIATAENALAGDTVASQLASFIGGTAGGQSFAEFLDDCAAGAGDTCVPSVEVLCGRQLVSNAYEDLTGLSASAPQAVATYRSVSREASLGPQLAAFYADTNTRLAWLQSTTFPAVVTSAVQGLNRGLLDDWRDEVLEVHVGVLADQFSAGSLSMLARGSEIVAVNDAREEMLLELSQSWRASAEALALAAARWNELFQDLPSRTNSAAYVRERLFDLYVMSGVLAELNRLASADFASSAFAGGFDGIVSELQQLAEPQTNLIFARDAEVVVSTSLDPQMGSDTVLSARRAAAMNDLSDAAESVNGTLADLQMDLVDEATLRGRIQTQVDTLYGEVVELCGLPIGCTLSDRADPDCRPRVEEGVCGLGVDPDTSSILALTGELPSEAGAAILDITAARNDVAIASAELRAQGSSAARYLRLTNDFATRVEGWNASRMAVDERVSALLDEAQMRRMSGLEALTEFVEAGQVVRAEAAAERTAWVAEWDVWAMDTDGDIATLLEASNTETTAVGLQLTADTLFAASDTAFGVAGLDSPNPAGFALGIVGAATAVAGAGFHVAAGIVDASAASLRDDVDRSMVARDFAMSRAEFEIDLQTAAREDQLANLEADMEALATANDFQDAILETIVDQLEGGLADELAYERDLQELDDRRVELHDRIGELDALRVRQSQARLTILQRILAYHQVVQRARLTEGRLRALEVQQSELNSLLGSPAVVFGWANRLTQAENRLERAKAAMTEWLVAIEYLAVRPFIDQRIQILLARNTFQLEDIAAELDRLQMSCGGAVNTTSVQVSVRDDLLGIKRGIIDNESGEELDAAARFRSVLAGAVVPIDKRVRYTSDGDVGDLVRNGNIQAATFDISLTDFANLEATCNAKVASVAIELVGEDLGTGRPTVSLLYDGASAVRSCQPNITSIVESIGRDATTFGSITTFRTAGRSVSPVAGVNEAGSSNMTLQGLPLASQYTVLIDPEIGENTNINWDALEDIVLHIEYVAQDVFPAGQCQ